MSESVKPPEVPPAEEETKWESDSLDTRLQFEFECLNSTSEVINKLENELDHARSKFRSLLSDSTHQLKLLCKKLGKCINKARPYYELLKQARTAQQEAQRAVVQFQRANSMYLAAKETVSIAEERLHAIEQEQRPLDPAWQDMLNHATMKFMESKREKAVMEENHLRRAAECADIERRRKALLKDMHRTIPKARPYFELKERLELQLEQEKQNVEDLQMALQAAKSQYHSAMRNLETISNQVHEQRQNESLPKRTPGVGAETDDMALPDIDIDCASHKSADRRESESTTSSTDVPTDEESADDDPDSTIVAKETELLNEACGPLESQTLDKDPDSTPVGLVSDATVSDSAVSYKQTMEADDVHNVTLEAASPATPNIEDQASSAKQEECTNAEMDQASSAKQEECTNAGVDQASSAKQEEGTSVEVSQNQEPPSPVAEPSRDGPQPDSQRSHSNSQDHTELCLQVASLSH